MKTRPSHRPPRKRLAALALAASVLAGPGAMAQAVEIPDPELRRMIWRALNEPPGDITVADLESLTELDASLNARAEHWDWEAGPLPLIESWEGLETARNLVSLNLRGGWGWDGMVSNLAIPDLALPSTLTALESLDLDHNQLTSLTLPQGLARLQTLSVHGNSLLTLAVPESWLSQLVIYGFPRDKVTLLPSTHRFHPATLLSDGRLRLFLSGPPGQYVHVQRSANLVDWEVWRTVTLDGTGGEVTDETTAASQRFYRVVDDNSAPGE
ncbi:MAG: leucine-rich repeat domain-containing protein [Verrucomicrobiales bacterium]|nr:leucine-rich repeat domain-containing protein [Verrucomicrobiales bacterium]